MARAVIPSPDELRPFRVLLRQSERAMGFEANSIKTMTRIPALSSAFGALAGLFVADPKRARPDDIVRLVLRCERAPSMASRPSPAPA